MNSCLYECQIMHARFSPRAHRFAYRIFMFGLDLDELDALHRRRRLFSFERANLYSFRQRDFLPTHTAVHPASPPAAASTPTAAPSPSAEPSPPSLKTRVRQFLAGQGVDLPENGRVMLITLPRVLGYLFNPVSFYFCYAADGSPVASIAEVTNTFRETKPYLLGPDYLQAAPPAPRKPGQPDSVSDLQLPTSNFKLRPPAPGAAGAPVFRRRTPKHFYVSPFSDVDVAFDFTLRTPSDRLSIQIDDYVGAERTLTSALTGRQRPLTDARLAWFTLKYPLITVKVIALIHWHAFRLYLKKIPWFPKAARAADQHGLYRPHLSIASTPDA